MSDDIAATQTTTAHDDDEEHGSQSVSDAPSLRHQFDCDSNLTSARDTTTPAERPTPVSAAAGLTCSTGAPAPMPSAWTATTTSQAFHNRDALNAAAPGSRGPTSPEKARKHHEAHRHSWYPTYLNGRACTAATWSDTTVAYPDTCQRNPSARTRTRLFTGF